MKNFILFSVVYILIFSGYYLTTSFLNILYPNYAFLSFVIFYGTYAIGSLFALFIINKINFKLVLFLSCLSFCIFVGFCGSNIIPLLLVGSFFGGLGNSVIWLVQGVFLESNEMALFYTLFNINIVFGNLIGLIILIAGLSVQIMILSMLVLTGLGTFIAIFVQNKIDIEKNNKNVEIQNKFSWGNIISIFKSVKNVYWIVPSYLYQALGLNVTYQIIPRLLFATSVETTYMKSIYNAIIFIIYGIFAMAFSWIWGKLFVKNWKYVVIPYSILEIICLLSILLLAKFNTQAGFWIIIGAIRGIIDYGVNNNINISLSNKNDNENNFALYRFIYALSYLLSSICIGYIPYEYVLLITLIFLIISAITNFLFQKYQKLEDIESQFNSTQIVIC
jgi:MFS family permease